MTATGGTDPVSRSRRIKRYLLKALVLAGICFAADRALSSFFRAALDHYHGLDVNARILLVGHSHTELGLDKCLLEEALGVPVAKYALDGAGTLDRYIMIQQYFARREKPPELVIYDVDAHTFTSNGLSSNSYTLFFPYLDNPVVDEYVRRNARSRSEYWIRKLVHLSRFDDTRINAVFRGLTSNWSNYKYGVLDVGALQRKIAQGHARPITFDQTNIDVFEKTLAFVHRHGAVLVLLYIPTFRAYNEIEPEHHAATIRMFEEYAKRNGVLFLNYNPEYAGRAELFYDPIHLNDRGRQAVTQTLVRDLRGLVEHGYACSRVHQ
jgi:hypothetical protein